MNGIYCPYKYDENKIEDYISFIENFISGDQDCLENLIKIMESEKTDISYGLKISVIRFIQFNMPLATLLMAYTEIFLEHFNTAIGKLQRILLAEHENRSNMRFKQLVCARLVNLPSASSEICRNILPRSNDIGKFISLSGTITSTGENKMLEWEKEFICAKCSYEFVHQADITLGYQFPEIIRCPSDGGLKKKKKSKKKKIYFILFFFF